MKKLAIAITVLGVVGIAGSWIIAAVEYIGLKSAKLQLVGFQPDTPFSIGLENILEIETNPFERSIEHIAAEYNGESWLGNSILNIEHQVAIGLPFVLDHAKRDGRELWACRISEKHAYLGFPAQFLTVTRRQYQSDTSSPLSLPSAEAAVDGYAKSQRNTHIVVTWGALALNSACISLMMFALLALRCFAQSAYRARRGNCTVCGYELGTLPTKICPECGAVRDLRHRSCTQS